jgi:hypothetical protein
MSLQIFSSHWFRHHFILYAVTYHPCILGPTCTLSHSYISDGQSLKLNFQCKCVLFFNPSDMTLHVTQNRLEPCGYAGDSLEYIKWTLQQAYLALIWPLACISVTLHPGTPNNACQDSLTTATCNTNSPHQAHNQLHDKLPLIANLVRPNHIDQNAVK